MILMAIPPFDRHGLLPVGTWDCSFTELCSVFGWNAHRAGLLDGLRDFISAEAVNWSVQYILYVDGSFTRTKEYPADIDIVLELDREAAMKVLARWMMYRNDWKQIYHLDVWTRYPGADKDLVSFFRYVGDKAAAELNLSANDLKGILRVTP